MPILFLHLNKFNQNLDLVITTNNNDHLLFVRFLHKNKKTILKLPTYCVHS